MSLLSHHHKKTCASLVYSSKKPLEFANTLELKLICDNLPSNSIRNYSSNLCIANSSSYPGFLGKNKTRGFLWSSSFAARIHTGQCDSEKVTTGLFSRGKVGERYYLPRTRFKDFRACKDNTIFVIRPGLSLSIRSLSSGSGGGNNNNKNILDQIMSMLLPINIGSPQSPVVSSFAGDMMLASSPMDDIAALTGQFALADHQSHPSAIGNNKRFQLRRKLSTSFDDPISSLLLGIAQEKARGLERSNSNKSNRGGGGGEIGGSGNNKAGGIGDIGTGGVSGGGAWLEEHFKRLNELRISECSEGDGDETSSVGSGGSSSGGGASRIQEDIFQLLEKVIAFKTRNVSHITVEQCVKDLCTVYNETEESDKLRFFMLLGENYGVDHASIVSLATSLGTCQEEQTKLNLEEKLRAALIPKYQWLFSQVGRLENGVKFLVDLRTDILDAIEKSTESTTHLKALNNCLKDLIGVWFAVGFLKLERITWNSSCEMLQKISEYEAVHPMRNWTDLKKRVGPNRRCFAFTHGSMPEEPVVVLHTALTNHIPSSIHKIVTKRRLMSVTSVDGESDTTAAEEVEDHDFIDTAIFYSITSTQRGLTGIELGNYLIKRVVRELQGEFPKIRQFSTLSPIPGFSKWLLGCIKTAQRDPDKQNLLTTDELDALTPLFKSRDREQEFFNVFQDVLKLNEWFSDEVLVKELESPLMRLCGQYLYLVKRRGYAMDPVAHFHLKNGAVLWRLNWLGDASPRGLTQACGMMVNYRYFLEDCETNSQNYLEQQTIQISDQLNVLVKQTESGMGSKL